METIKNVFNIGHGPSSSHTMGPQRAALIFKDMYPQAKSFVVTLYGSLAATGKGHLTEKAIKDSLAPHKVTIEWKAKETLPRHPNGMKFKGFAKDKELVGEWIAYSIGGGAVRSEEEWDSPPPKIYPHTTMDEILEWCLQRHQTFWEYVNEYEDWRDTAELEKVWKVMDQCIRRGLNTKGPLPGPLGLQRQANILLMPTLRRGKVFQDIMLISLYALAAAEENAAGGEVVTAPTCGSCGVLPAVLFFLKEEHHVPDYLIYRALFTAGLIGTLIKKNGSISGAEVGCQGEIGSACAMTAAAAAFLFDGNPRQIEYAAEMGLEHFLGLTCDPVEGFVQIPCIERNVTAALTAMQCALFAISSEANYRISFDEVVQTMKETGCDLQPGYKETAMKGLAKNWLNSEKRKKKKDDEGW